eukprot:Colp12_sorted_trinity150504_noHs@28039
MCAKATFVTPPIQFYLYSTDTILSAFPKLPHNRRGALWIERYRTLLATAASSAKPDTRNLEVGEGRRAGEHAALALLLGHTSLEEDVAIHAPRRTPGVLHLVVVGAVQGAVADGQDAVVQVGAAGSGEHTRLVQLEGGLVGLDGDGHGLLSQGGHHGGVGVLLHVSVGLGGDLGVLGALGVAGASLLGGAGHVGVVSLSADTAPLGGPVEGGVHEAAVAAHVGAAVGLHVAVHKVLLGEGHQGAVLDLVSTLQSTGGGERPAGTARALVLDGGDGTLGGPVDGRGEGHGVGRGGEHVGGGGDLGLLHVGELVVAELVGAVELVVGLDQIIVVGEVLEHGHEVSTGGGLNLVLGKPVEELLLVEGSVVDVGRSNGGDSSDNGGTSEHFRSN